MTTFNAHIYSRVNSAEYAKRLKQTMNCFSFFFFFTEACFANKYLFSRRKEEQDRKESSDRMVAAAGNRWNVYDGALNRSIKRTWRGRNARKPEAWLFQPQKKRLERSVERRTIVTYILISTRVRLRASTRERGVGTRRAPVPVPNISRDIGDVKMLVYELPKRKSFLLTTVLFSADCKSTMASHGSFQENRRETFLIEFTRDTVDRSFINN